jgi:hypothetical protein
MDATPFEQVLVEAVATYCTGDPTVAPLLGLLTATFANADVANIKNVDIKNVEIRKQEFFIKLSPGLSGLKRVLRNRKSLICLMNGLAPTRTGHLPGSHGNQSHQIGDQEYCPNSNTGFSVAQ